MYKIELSDYGCLIVSEGTLNPEHLIPTFLSFLSDYTETEAEDREIKALFAEYEVYKAMEYYEGGECMLVMLSFLYDMMQDIAPDGTYFCGSEGDPACIGFWMVEENDF